MRVLVIHPQSDYNIGDLMTYYGFQYLLRRAFDDVEFLQFDSRRAEVEMQTYVPEYNWGATDMIALAGSPWVGANDGDKKVLMLEQAIARFPSALRVALGIGSVLSVTRTCDKNYEGVNVDLLRSFSLVIVRDRLANDILTSKKIPCEEYIDTSIFSYAGLDLPSRPRRLTNILLYYDPKRNDVVDHLAGKDWDAIVDYQLSWAKKANAEVLCITSGDKASLDEKGVEGRFVTDIQWLAKRYSTGIKVLCGRVHQAILAKISGAKAVALIPVDSRFLTAARVGIEIVDPISRFKGIGYDKQPFSISKLRRKVYEKWFIKRLRGL